MKLLISFVAMAILIGASLWAIAYPIPPFRLSKRLAKIAFVLGLAILLMGWLTVPPALANTQHLKEADQWVYQAEELLSDSQGTLWEVTLIKQMDGADRGLSLRLTTKSPLVLLDASQPLNLTTDLGQQLTADNITAQQFIGSLPDDNVGQYDVKALLPAIKAADSVTLQLPTRQKAPITLVVPSDILDEWVLVGSCDYIICDK